MKIKETFISKRNEYTYELMQEEKVVEELIELPMEVVEGSIIQINSTLFRVGKIYDCELSDKNLEVVWYELAPFRADFVLEVKEFVW